MKVILNLRYNSESENTDKTLEGIMVDNKFIYKEDNFIVTLTALSDKLVLSKKNDEYRLEISLMKDDSRVTYYGTNNEVLNIKAELLKYEREDNRIYFHYIVEDINEIKFNLTYEVIE